MNRAEIHYNSNDKRFFFVIRNENGSELFQSGEWYTEQECADGITGFTELLQQGSFEARKKPRNHENQYFIQFVSDQNEIWGRSALRQRYEESLADYEALKSIFQGEVSVVNVESIPLDRKIMDFLYSLDGAGYKDPEKNPTDEKQWEIAWEVRTGTNGAGEETEMRQFELWRNHTLQNSFVKNYFKNLPEGTKTENPAKEYT